jgi:NADH:ubiquinone oxidoreductase subunit 3 (subunit A)
MLVILALAAVFVCSLMARRLRPRQPTGTTPSRFESGPSVFDRPREFPFRYYGLAFVGTMLPGVLAFLLIWASEFRVLSERGQDSAAGILGFLVIVGTALAHVWRKSGFR